MMFTTPGHLLVFCALLLMVDCGQEGMSDAVPMDRGHQNGREKIINYRKQRQKADLQEKSMDHGGEPERIAMEEEFMNWKKECASVINTDITECRPLSKNIRTFMQETGMSEEDVKDQTLIMRDKKNKNGKNRNKRSYLLADSGIWTKCIVPFIWDDSLPESDRIGIGHVHKLYEQLTGFRFVYYNGNNSEYGLDHDNYIKYIDGGGCWSYVGNLGGHGQSLSACGGGSTAVHEIGHALGMMHEQQTPASYPWLTMKYSHQQPNYRSQYYRSSFESVWNHDRVYDISSVMHYGDWGFSQNYGKTMVVNDPDMAYLTGNDNNYYMFKTLQEYHQCYDEFPSCKTMPDCDFGGYPSIMDGVCKCRCPDGLNSDTLCKMESVKKNCFTNPSTWVGSISQTVSGRTCQAWVLDTPHEHSVHDDAKFPDGSQIDAKNYCRDPDGEGAPWCYTTDPKQRWEYCGVPRCNDGGEIKTFTTESSYSFTSPGYPVAYPVSTQYTWHFQSPAGTRMQLDFSDFEVSHSTDTRCNAFVEVKHVLPGMNGFKFCGHKYKKTTWTVNNYLTLRFLSDTSTPWKGFNATITILKDDDLCYAGDGGDRSYAGQVNYAKSFDPCLPWKDVQHCLYQAFDFRTGDDGLVLNNYCRNVGVGTQPWCYTDSETCERQNCDACMLGACYDLADDCAAKIAADPDFCITNEHGEARRICMESCGGCAQHVKKASVKDVTCDMPCDVTDIGARPLKESYSVGEVVTYTCPANIAEKRTRTCTSEGTWTQLNFVCGACPTGWAVHGHTCYKWLGWEVSLDFHAAKNACAALNAHLLKVDSVETQKFLGELLEYDKEQSADVWIGIKADDNRNWHWSDGEPLGWSNWNSGEPNDWNGIEDCAISKSSGVWADYPCQDYNLFDVVCEITPTASTCLDQLDDCELILMTMPDMCVKYPDYAWHNCRKTCGVGFCNPMTKCTDDANLSYRGTRVYGDAQVAVGQYVEHRCNDGYFHTSGSLTRACLPSGSLTGKPPVCLIPEVTPDVDLFTNNDIYRRRYGGSRQVTLILANSTSDSNMKFTAEGKVTSWTFYSNYVGTIALQVWRPNGVDYQLIGQNIINTVEDRKYTVRIDDVTAQIHAKVNDLVGIWQQSGELSYTPCDHTIMPENAHWFQTTSSFTNAEDMISGTDYPFQVCDMKCRIYSIRATVNPSAVCA